MTNTITRKPTPLMLEALIVVANAKSKSEVTYLDRYRNSTVLGLEKRGLIELTDAGKGYVLTLGGFTYLRDNRFAAFSSDDFQTAKVVHAQTTPISVLDYTRIMREYYVNAALKSRDSEFTGKLREVSDTLNNVGRRCNVKNNGDTETRCWEILAQVNYIIGAVKSETIYLCRYVGNERPYMFETPLSGVFLYGFGDLTNLY